MGPLVIMAVPLKNQVHIVPITYLPDFQGIFKRSVSGMAAGTEYRTVKVKKPPFGILCGVSLKFLFVKTIIPGPSPHYEKTVIHGKRIGGLVVAHESRFKTQEVRFRIMISLDYQI